MDSPPGSRRLNTASWWRKASFRGEVLSADDVAHSNTSRVVVLIGNAVGLPAAHPPVRATYLSLIVAIGFACPLMAYQLSLFAGLMLAHDEPGPDVRDAQAGE
jgi:hypothetical protein